MSKKIILFLLLVTIAIVFYYSWQSDPSLENNTYLPQWLLKWSNEYYNLRTAIPFLAVGFLLEAYSQYKGIYEMNYNQKASFFQNIGIATIIAFVAEGGQFLIQSRSPDLMDVFYATIGSLIGGLGYYMFSMLFNSNR
ncbi:VanZ family protein [Flavobacterium faecale]|uniref:VanZ family protein n=1 Tax=Flavobacterium faecale TaxID=1355330 RepID=UPI003AAA741D